MRWQALAEVGCSDLEDTIACTSYLTPQTPGLEKAARVRWQALAEVGSSDLEDTLGGVAPLEAWVRYGSAGHPAASDQAPAHPAADLDDPRSPPGPATPTASGGVEPLWDVEQAAATLAPAELVLLCARQQVSAAAAGQASYV